MKAKKTIRRRKAKPPFKPALTAARAVLESKKELRTHLLSELQDLNRDIPNLERTVMALEAQLSGKGVMHNAGSKQSVQPNASATMGDHGALTSDIPPEIRAQLPPEDFSQFGSHYSEESAEEDTFLPKIDGKPVTPEKI